MIICNHLRASTVLGLFRFTLIVRLRLLRR